MSSKTAALTKGRWCRWKDKADMAVSGHFIYLIEGQRTRHDGYRHPQLS